MTTGDVKQLRRRHGTRGFLQARAALQGQRLVAQQHLDDNVASIASVKRVLCDQVAAFRDDLVGILHDLELLVAVVLMQPHALADDFEDIDDTEWPVALVRAQLAMIGMIDRNQRIDTRVARRLELVELQLALERGKYADIDALQADRRLLQVDEFNAGDRPQGFQRRLP